MIKKVLFVVMLLSFLTLIACEKGISNKPPADVQENPASDFTYVYNTELKGIEITEYTGTTMEVRIPEKIEGEPVTGIGSEAFENTGIQSVYMPNTVVSIEDYAFAGCIGLADITLPEGVTKIGECAFAGCTGLTSVTIPSGITVIGYSAFRDCTGLTSVTIPSSVTVIGQYAFYGCTGLTSVTLPDSLTELASWAFADIACGATLTFKGNTYTAIERTRGSNIYYSAPDELYNAVR